MKQLIFAAVMLVAMAMAGASFAGDTAPQTSCEKRCTEVCDGANVPSCVAGCIITGHADCATNADDIERAKEKVGSCEQACAKCAPWNVPGCVAGCIAGDPPACDTTPSPDSCTGECGHHCPPWKDPVQYSNCLVSCANTGDWACYDDQTGLPCD